MLTKAELLQKVEALGPYAAPVVVQVYTEDPETEEMIPDEELELMDISFDGETLTLQVVR